jgi:carbon storage regulator
MLVLTRRVAERVVVLIDGEEKLWLTVVQQKDNSVRLGFEAGQDVEIHREEIYDRIKRENGNR